MAVARRSKLNRLLGDGENWRCIVDYVCTFFARNGINFFREFRIVRVYGNVTGKLVGASTAFFARLTQNHAGTFPLGKQDVQKSHCSAADNKHVVAETDIRLIDAVDDASKRLGERHALKGGVGGIGQQVISFNRDKLSETAVAR